MTTADQACAPSADWMSAVRIWDGLAGVVLLAAAALVLLTFSNYGFTWYIFFFQAEDGIRDSSVTGVQTCALPILGERRGAEVFNQKSERSSGKISLWFAPARQSVRVSANNDGPRWAPAGLRSRSGRYLWQQQAFKKNIMRYASSLRWARSAATCSTAN